MGSSPIVVDGVLYNVQPWNIVTAFDADGPQALDFRSACAAQYGRMACCDIVSRGLAAWKGKIYVASLDGRLIALDAGTGKPVWSNAYGGRQRPRLHDHRSAARL